MPEHLIIIGNGISGTTCAREVRKRDAGVRITIISSESPHFFSRTALMYVYMGHMKHEHIKPYEDSFWEKNRLELVHDAVTKVDTRGKVLMLKSGAVLPYDKLVVACGSQSNIPDWPGKDLRGVQGLYSLQDLEGMESQTKGIRQAVIIGGGLIGIEMAEMLRSRGIGVKMLVREKLFWNSVLSDEEAAMIGRHAAEHGVELLPETELESLHDKDGNGRLHHIKTKDGRTIECEFAGLTVGVRANIAFLKESGIETDKGILVNEAMETSVPDVFAIGDCVQYRKPPEGRKPVEQVWYTGRMHGEILARTLCGERTPYTPGPWFNSAKFFDIEYQTYGLVPAKTAEGQRAFYWEHPGGKISFRAVYDEQRKTLQGINVFGMRLRHEVADRWLRERRNMSYVMAHLADAQFDPEFYRHYEGTIMQAYNMAAGTSVKPERKSWKRILGFAS